MLLLLFTIEHNADDGEVLTARASAHNGADAVATLLQLSHKLLQVKVPVPWRISAI